MNGHRLDIDLLIIEENSKGMNSLHARLGALKFRNLSSITSFDKLPEFAALLYFIVMFVGFIVFFFKPTDLAQDLFYALIGAAIAAFTHYLKN